MEQVTKGQVRRFRLRAHHLDAWYKPADLEGVVGACGMQNSPPGAWQKALYNRIPALGKDAARRLLEEDKRLLQAWSFRGAPVVFPTSQSGAFLAALVPQAGEPWIYTKGIGLALDYLGMGFAELLGALVQVMPGLDGEVLEGKATLDQTLAEWMQPLLPKAKRDLWCAPSMYGNPGRQTVGGAVVSFLLRPCAYKGLVVFGKRQGTQPTFTSYKSWCGQALNAGEYPQRQLVRKFLHCHGPALPGGLANWLGCSGAQARRLWQSVEEELVPVLVQGKKRYILAADKGLLLDPPQPKRTVHLLAGHDPYLDLCDRELVLEDRARQRMAWQTVANPGVVLHQGKIAGLWKQKKSGKGMALEVTLWEKAGELEKNIPKLAERQAAGQGLRLEKVTYAHE